MELIKDQHKSPALLRYADRITENRFDSNGGFNLAGGIADARWVFLPSPSSLLLSSFFLLLLLSYFSLFRPQEFRVIRSMSCRGLEVHSVYMLQLGCSWLGVGLMSPTLNPNSQPLYPFPPLYT
jgi:hypothetical protein